MRILVVEDELPALEELRYMIQAAQPAHEVETASTAIDALRMMSQHRFDVVFADIHMPGLSGLELVNLMKGLEDPPRVVFVTAYDEYAVRAFELQAVDYLMKPVSPARLRQTLERLQSGVARPVDPDASPRPTDPDTAPRPTWLEKLPVESGGRTMLIDLPEIRYAEARDNTVYVRTHDRFYATRYSLNEMERRLPSPPFLRIHRAFVVNMRNVVEISPYFNGAYVLRVNDATSTELTVSRGRVKDLRTLLGL